MAATCSPLRSISPLVAFTLVAFCLTWEASIRLSCLALGHADTGPVGRVPALRKTSGDSMTLKKTGLGYLQGRDTGLEVGEVGRGGNFCLKSG